MKEQFTRTIGLIGEEGFDKLQSSHVLVCGLGGVGGTALEALSRSGIGNFTLIDFDVVDPSNLNRQILYKQEDIEDILKSIQKDNVPKKTIVKKHDILEFKNKVIQGDCLDVMAQMPDKSIDMILADLPYGTTQASFDTVIPFEPLWEQYHRVIKDNGAIV